MLDNLQSLSLSQIAALIRKDNFAYFGAVPYIEAMSTFTTGSMAEMYGCEDAYTIVNYFLANAGSWRGETARAIKKELNRRLKKGK